MSSLELPFSDYPPSSESSTIFMAPQQSGQMMNGNGNGGPLRQLRRIPRWFTRTTRDYSKYYFLVLAILVLAGLMLMYRRRR